ncbi:hypothetical protein RR48_10510 [Papilio machaon]|uniref:Uncharacterized protein n=1 Tax=Papilio machaon TaxID=76193 RepID=A0A194R6L2_PAPMA|nr:hypothetical protein RR48_10510 [Papilio machaon]
MSTPCYLAMNISYHLYQRGTRLVWRDDYSAVAASTGSIHCYNISAKRTINLMRCSSPAAASTTVLVDEVGGDTTSDVSLITMFLKNILNLGLGSAAPSTSSTARPTHTPTPTPKQPNTRICDKNIIRAFVDVKVKELMPFLQDDEYAEAEVEAEAEGDTDILQPPPELVALRQRPPPPPPGEGVRRYRRLRRRIHRALLRETVSNDTLHLIIQTIDEMIANMVAGRCAVRGGARGEARGEGPPPPEPRAEDAASRPAAWRLEWQKIREKYSDLFRGNDSAPRQRLNEIVGSLMDKLPTFFADVLRDGETLAERYGVRCERTRPAGAGGEGGAAPERSRALAGNATCVAATRICSGELRRFLVRLFKAVNESSSRVLRDYLEMYKIDVNIDPAAGPRGILSTLREINREAEVEVCKIFAKKIRSLVAEEGKKRGLDEADLKDLIRHITENVKMHTNEIVRVEMAPIDTELKERILKDLEDDMRVELDRLAREAELTICSAFATCNGRYSVRRAGPARRGVFVRVQLQLEEQPARAPRRTAPPPSQDYTSFSLSEVPIQIKYSTFDTKNYDMKSVNVTRTTTFYSENSNTKISQ